MMTVTRGMVVVNHSPAPQVVQDNTKTIPSRMDRSRVKDGFNPGRHATAERAEASVITATFQASEKISSARERSFTTYSRADVRSADEVYS